MSYASVALGQECAIHVGNDTHPARIFGTHVGRSSVGGKSMALALTCRIRRAIENGAQPDNPVSGNMHDGGLSTREGLAIMIRDASDTKEKDGDPSDPGVDDKRLWIVEQEFANVLSQSQRDGNTLSSALRVAWDGGDLAPATKNNRTRASPPHIGLHCCITPTELGAALSQREMTNGFANRFLFVFAERQGVIPFPRRATQEEVQNFALRLRDAIDFSCVAKEVRPDPEAVALYVDFYRQHRRGIGLSMQVRGIIERHPPYAWRLSLMFALLDRTETITRSHMKTALAWLDYCRESTALIFSSATVEANAQKAGDLAKEIVSALEAAPGQAMTREPLRVAIGKPSKGDFDSAIEQLSLAGRLEETSKPRQGGGRPLRAYALKDSQRFERFGSAQGLQQTADPARFAAVCSGTETPTDQTAQTAEPLRFAGSLIQSQTAQTADVPDEFNDLVREDF